MVRVALGAIEASREYDLQLFLRMAARAWRRASTADKEAWIGGQPLQVDNEGRDRIDLCEV